MKGCLALVLGLCLLGGLVGASIWLGTTPPEELSPFARFMADTGMNLVVGGLVGLGLLAGIGAGLRRRRQEAAAWSAFAARHALARTGSGDEERLAGQALGRGVVLRTYRGGRGQGRLFQALEVDVRGVPAGTWAWARVPGQAFLARVGELMLPGLRERLESDTVESGDEALDRAVHLVAEDAAAARAWLTPARREALRELCANAGQRLEPDRVTFARQGRSWEPGELDASLARLADLAGRLEGCG